MPIRSHAGSPHETIHRDLLFADADGVPLKLDLYIPSADRPPPLVMWIHGGGWRSGSKAKPLIRSLTSDGFALASISYRFTQQAIFPAQIHDCKGAVRWLRAHQTDYGYDARWLGVVGCSSGGHLAMLLGTSGGMPALEGDVGGNVAESSRVQTIVSHFGPSDFVLRGQTQPEIAYNEQSGSFALLGGVRLGQVQSALEVAASPVTYVSADSPPLLVFHGTDDQLVLLNQSERIVAAYRQADRPAQLVVVPGAGHGGAVFYWGEHLDTLRGFLRSHCPSFSDRAG